MVAVQGEAFHGDITVYMIPPGASPEQAFTVGLNCLRGGMVGKAREHITQAVVDGHVTSRSCFYLLLALLSGRTLQQVPDHELSCLAMAQGKIAGHAEDEWTRAVRVINRLLESLRAGDVDASGVEERLRELSDDRRDEILRHLELFLHGPVQNASWARAFAQANRDRCDSARLDRVWKFFQPKPFEPRARPARSPDTPISGWILSATTTALSLTAIGHVSLQAWLYSWSSTVLATLLLAAGAYGCVPAGVEWRYRSERLRAMDRELRTARQRSAEGLPRGFSSRIDRQFIDYFARYVPRTIEREAWLALTDGIRQVLRDEVIELYRESKIDAKRVSWLIRYLVSDVKDRWQRGLLHQDRDLLRVPAATKARFALGALVSGAGLVSLLWSGFTISPFSVVGAALLAAVVGVVAVRGWLRIVLEYKWYAADRIREKRQLNERQAAFDRWTRKLKDKPDDREMASWLDCDRKALTEEAMRHYKLQPDDVIAHAFIEAPATSYKRARVRNGPWRYSRYKLLVFLLTADGVRQMSVDLDFQKVTFHNRRRINYRYDAVAAVQVIDADDGRRTFELTLVNGHPIEVEVTGPPPNPESEPEEDPRTVSQVTLDTAGLGNTLHVLEGVAAEGKEWIKHERERERDRLTDLANAARGFYR
ncbi:hypothetical protein ACFQE7_12500 [Nonomuraea ferruginea]